MKPPERNALMQDRFKRLFIEMVKSRGLIYSSGFFLGWLAHLAIYDITIIRRLEKLEEQYKLQSRQ